MQKEYVRRRKLSYFTLHLAMSKHPLKNLAGTVSKAVKPASVVYKSLEYYGDIEDVSIIFKERRSCLPVVASSAGTD